MCWLIWGYSGRITRELTTGEVADITAHAHARGVETEHFVHGALCYAFWPMLGEQFCRLSFGQSRHMRSELSF